MCIIDCPNILAIIAGDGPLKLKVEAYLRVNKLEHRVALPGHIDNVAALYARADIVVLCSDAEGQPYAVLEAMKQAKAIIASDVPGCAELIENQKSGLLVMPEPQAIAAAIKLLAADEQLRVDYGKNSYLAFCKHHLLHNQIIQLDNIYRGSAD
jgi:glycosyltransferase involved in cell wall biosynthesis